MEKSKEQERKEAEASAAKKREERTPKAPTTQMIGWTDAEIEALGEERHGRLEPVVVHLQRQEGIRIRSAGTSAERAAVGILDGAGQWIPRESETREWPVAIAALNAAGFTVTDDGELVAFMAPAAEPKPSRASTRRGAAAEA